MQFTKIALAGATAISVVVSLALDEPSHTKSVPRASDIVSAIEARSGSNHYIAQVGNVTIYKPKGDVRGVVLFLSGDGGWNLGVVDMARALNRQGVAVAGVSSLAFLKALEASSDKCVNVNFALIAVAQDVEHRLGLPQYIKPILAGYSSGATIAYAALAQAPVGIYRGAVSLGFGPDINGSKPWCAAKGFSASKISTPQSGWVFGPDPHLPAPWLVLQGQNDVVVSPAITQAFTSRIPEAQLIMLPNVGHGFSVTSKWMPQFLTAFTSMLKAPELTPPRPNDPATASINDLPLTLVSEPQSPRTNFIAVMYSGDGGWAGLDRDLAAKLAASGVPVVGVDSLSYFWNAKSPAQAGSDLGRVISHFSKEWQRPKVILIGYSFGADDLPFVVNAMPPVVKNSIARMTMMGLDKSADLQFHLSSWLDVSGASALPTIPEIERLKGLPMQCIRGASESDSACNAIPASLVQKIVIPGGHHFDGNADLLKANILKGLAL